MNSPSSLHRIRPICALAALLGLGAARGNEVVLRLGTILPSGTPQHTELLALGERWRQASQGSVRLVLYPDGRLGGESEMVKKMRIQQLNACVLSAVGLSEIDPAIAGLQMIPLEFRSWDEVDHTRSKVRPLLEERLRARGYEVLFWADAGWVHFFSKQPAAVPDDLKRSRIFVWAGDVPQSEIMKSLGYNPVGLETTDIALGLNTDMINVVPVPPLIALATQLYGTAPYMLDLNWCPIVGAAVVRADTWNRLSPELRRQLRETAETTGERLRAAGRREDEESVRVMASRGLRVHHLTAEESAAWNRLALELHRRVRGTMVPADIFDEVEKDVAEYRRGLTASLP